MVSQPWVVGTTLEVVLPDMFEVPAVCTAVPLVPWVSPLHLECNRTGDRGVVVTFGSHLDSGQAVGMRLAPFRLPPDFDAVHPGFRAFPKVHDTVQPMSLNIRLVASRPSTDPTELPAAGDACHPAVWSCGLHPSGWAMDVAIRPSRHKFASMRVDVLGDDPYRARTGRASVQFSLESPLLLGGELTDVLILSPPYGYSLLGVLGSSLQVRRTRAETAQLNLLADIPLADGVHLGGPVSVLRVPNLIGNLSTGLTYTVDVSFAFPSSGVEPSIADASSDGATACSDMWGFAIESAGEHLAAAFTPSAPLAFRDFKDTFYPLFESDNNLVPRTMFLHRF